MSEQTKFRRTIKDETPIVSHHRPLSNNEVKELSRELFKEELDYMRARRENAQMLRRYFIDR